ncbi:unnamed protein product [Tilletia controversa]|nr:unnamed protein product [Tilletia controversa]
MVLGHPARLSKPSGPQTYPIAEIIKRMDGGLTEAAAKALREAFKTGLKDFDRSTVEADAMRNRLDTTTQMRLTRLIDQAQAEASKAEATGQEMLRNPPPPPPPL